jgi:hypothetical protein
MFWFTSHTLVFAAMNLPLLPWTSWAEVHFDFSRIDQYPKIAIPAYMDRNYHAIWWMVPALTFIFVAFFSFGRDAIDEYKKDLGCSSAFYRAGVFLKGLIPLQQTSIHILLGFGVHILTLI